MMRKIDIQKYIYLLPRDQISRRRWDLDQAGATMLKKKRKSVFT